jgi:ubiquinone/menaquinone biosynthesis C-methylase UbiE
MVERNEHNKLLSEHFSGLSSYWKDIYSRPVARWDFFHQVAAKRRKDAVVNFVKQLASDDSKKILDCGCGAGIIMEAILGLGHDVVGIDLSEEMLKVAREALHDYNPNLKVGSVESLFFQDEIFDICLCIGVLQYLEDDEPALRELARVLKPGGHAIISIPNIARVTTLFDPFYYLRRLPHFIIYRILRIKKRDKSLTSRDIGKNTTFRNKRYYYGQLNRLYKRYGLDVSYVVPIGYGPLTFWERECFSREFTIRAGEKIERLAGRKGFSFLKAIANRWVVVLKKRDDAK